MNFSLKRFFVPQLSLILSAINVIERFILLLGNNLLSRMTSKPINIHWLRIGYEPHETNIIHILLPIIRCDNLKQNKKSNKIVSLYRRHTICLKKLYFHPFSMFTIYKFKLYIMQMILCQIKSSPWA